MSKEIPGIEIIKDKLYFTTATRTDNNQQHFFTVCDELTYEPFFADFGPLNLGHVYSYCRFLEAKFQDPVLAHKKLYHYSSADGAKRTNAVFLLGAYCVLVQHWEPEAVYRIFTGTGAAPGASSMSSATSLMASLIPFRDASVGPSTFGLTVLECWKSLIKANSCAFFDLTTFDPNEYYFYERVENGDMNWIVPGKFLAFSGPHASHHSEAGLRTLTPDDYIPYFKKHHVTTVVRLNKKVYDKKRFTDYGVKHVDLYFVDGSTPSDSIVQRFLEVVETEAIAGGAIAVHCKAGLGRTGTLIGCSLMKHYKFTAHEAIGWLRICRPGSVIGPQQHFLVQMQSSLWREGDLYRKKQEQNGKSKGQRLPASSEYNDSPSLQSSVSDVSSKPVISNTRPDVPSKSSGVSDGTGQTTTKERLKADMRLITATLKSMRTTPPTTPTIPQSTPKFSPTTLDSSPYPSTSPPLTNSNYGDQLYGNHPVSNTNSTNGVSPSLYLNSPYATKSYKSTTSSTFAPTTGVAKGKLPSGLSLQHRKIENQTNRNNVNGAPVPQQRSKTTSQTVTPASPSAVPTPAAPFQKATRSSSYDRHTSPTTRSLFVSPTSSFVTSTTTTTSPSSPFLSSPSSLHSTSSLHSMPASPSSLHSAHVSPSLHSAPVGSTVSTKQVLSRKTRSSGNILSPYTSHTALPVSGSVSRIEFTPTRSAHPIRSISNSSPSSSFYNQPHSSLSRSKTPSPPRRHASANSSSSNYGSYLVDSYQKKTELRYTKH